MKHYTLGGRRGDVVHVVVRSYTACGVSLAFAADPQPTESPVTCSSCLTATKDRLGDAVLEYGSASRRWGMSLRRSMEELATAERRSSAALGIVLALLHHGEDRVVPVASLAPDGAP